jgi:hypothetical protein
MIACLVLAFIIGLAVGAFAALVGVLAAANLDREHLQ